MPQLSFIQNLNLIAIQNVVIGSYLAISKDEIAIELCLVLQERGFIVIVPTRAMEKHHGSQWKDTYSLKWQADKFRD